MLLQKNNIGLKKSFQEGEKEKEKEEDLFGKLNNNQFSYLKIFRSSYLKPNPKTSAYHTKTSNKNGGMLPTKPYPFSVSLFRMEVASQDLAFSPYLSVFQSESRRKNAKTICVLIQLAKPQRKSQLFPYLPLSIPRPMSKRK